MVNYADTNGATASENNAGGPVPPGGRMIATLIRGREVLTLKEAARGGGFYVATVAEPMPPGRMSAIEAAEVFLGWAQPTEREDVTLETADLTPIARGLKELRKGFDPS